jgi:succinyl-diaminopimelate desuccinylase
MATLDLGAGSVALTRQLVDIESVSGDEAGIADAIETALIDLPHLDVIRDRDAVVAFTSLGRPRRVVIAGHIDTVPVHDNLPSQLHRSDLDGEVLWGRGAVDMKGGCAAMLVVAAEVANPVVDVTWVWYDNEEIASEFNGLGRLIENRPGMFQASFAVLCEPTNAEVEGGCNGTLRIEVAARGRRAHSARAWMGENAIHKAAPILARLNSYDARTVRVDGLDYREGVNAVGIRGGVAGNVIPDECVVTINYRFAPDKTGAEALQHMRQLFEGFEVTVTDLAEGARPGLDAPFTRAFLDAVGGLAKPKYGWTDVARFAALGIPAVNYGPGDPSLAHADDERLPLAQVRRVEQGLRSWLTGT